MFLYVSRHIGQFRFFGTPAEPQEPQAGKWGNMKNLTDRYLDSKPEPGKRLEVRDAKTAGLIFRVSEKGHKSWSVLYRRKADGKRRRAHIGDYPSFGLAQARTEALSIMARVARGEDPAKDRVTVDSSKPRTFGELAARYVDGHAKGKKSGFKDEQMLNKNVLPSLEGTLLKDVHRSDIAAILDAMVKRGAPIQANRTFEVIRKVFNWAIEKGFLEISPVYRMKAPAKNRRRERALSADEIRVCCRRLYKLKMSWETRMILRLCLVTGQRVSEVAGARESELRLDKAEWHLPGERVKNQTPHIVPLPPLAKKLFQKAIAKNSVPDWIFPSPTTGGPITGHAVAKAMHRSRKILALATPVTPHDLRRTCASFMAELGFSRFIQDKVLNHVTEDRSSIAGVYDRYSYLNEKRRALEAWAVLLIEFFKKEPAGRNSINEI
jgi:integrase